MSEVSALCMPSQKLLEAWPSAAGRCTSAAHAVRAVCGNACDGSRRGASLQSVAATIGHAWRADKYCASCIADGSHSERAKGCARGIADSDSSVCSHRARRHCKGLRAVAELSVDASAYAEECSSGDGHGMALVAVDACLSSSSAYGDECAARNIEIAVRVDAVVAFLA